MKKVLATLLTIVSFSVLSFAQIKSPQPSPNCELEQKVGLTEIEIAYSRPGAKDRAIFGADGLVPFGEMWRTGANAATTISFDKDVTVEGQALKAGDYALYTIPGKNEWTVIFYTDLTNWGVPQEYKAENEALKVMVKPVSLNRHVETFTIGINNIRNASCDLELTWEKTLVPVQLGFNTDEEVLKSIDKTLAGPGSTEYYLAARYYHESGKDLDKAYEWVKKANDINATYWQVRREAVILADMERYQEAIQKAKSSKEMAQKAGNMDYVRMNDKSIAEWTAMLGRQAKPEAPKKLKKEAKMK